jgi:hypothetical protein
MSFEDIVYARLKFLGLPQDVTYWHSLEHAYSYGKLAHEHVNANVENMTKGQVVAFVRKHGASHPAAMVCMWHLQDRMTLKDLAWCFEGFNKHHTWLVAAHMIAGMSENNACDLVYDQMR